MGQARALVFDFNGTLSHDEPLLYAIYAELFAAHGRPLAEADYFGSLAGNTEEAIIGGWLGVDGDELADARRGADRPLRRSCGWVDDPRRAPRGGPARRRRGFPSPSSPGPSDGRSSPCSSGPASRTLIGVIVTADDVARGKPDPEGYRRALERLGGGLAPGDVVAFEDTEAGVASARLRAFAASRCAGRFPTSGSPRRTRSSTRSTSSSCARLLG